MSHYVYCKIDIIYILMNSNFKNPFELDEEDTIISLDPVPQANQSKNNQQTSFNPAIMGNFQNVPASNPLNPPAANNESMFDLLDTNANEANIAQEGEMEEPPLLEDIGIDINLIKNRFINIITLGEVNRQLIESPDLSGPIIISFLLGFLLLLGGKIHFSDILTSFVIGNGVMYLLFNFMGRETIISFYCVMSFLGYSLLPMLVLAAFGILFSLNGAFGVFSSLILAAWSSYTAGNIISFVINRLEDKILITFPLFLFYVSFALIIIF